MRLILPFVHPQLQTALTITPHRLFWGCPALNKPRGGLSCSWPGEPRAVPKNWVLLAWGYSTGATPAPSAGGLGSPCQPGGAEVLGVCGQRARPLNLHGALVLEQGFHHWSYACRPHPHPPNTPQTQSLNKLSAHRLSYQGCSSQSDWENNVGVRAARKQPHHFSQSPQSLNKNSIWETDLLCSFKAKQILLLSKRRGAKQLLSIAC